MNQINQVDRKDQTDQIDKASAINEIDKTNEIIVKNKKLTPQPSHRKGGSLSILIAYRLEGLPASYNINNK
jgi:hypothetical protein